MPLMNLFGGGKPAPPPRSNAIMEEDAANFARSLTGYAPGEEALLARLEAGYSDADARMLRELDALRTRGEGLLSLDPTRFSRLYDPAIDRLKATYADADRGVTEEMNRRGIAGVGNFAPDVEGIDSGEAMSSPEMYSKALVSREFAREAGNVMKDAQANAVNQQIAAYNARVAEPNAAANRFQQVANPLINAKVTPESERMGQRANLTTSTIGQKLGHQAQQHATNTQRKIAGQEQLTNIIGGGLGAVGSGLGMLALSDPNAKEDISPTAGPEEEEAALEDIRGTGLHRFNYKGDDQERFGPMADAVPEDMGDGETIDLTSWMGKITAAIKALDKKVGDAYGNGLRATAVRGGGV